MVNHQHINNETFDQSSNLSPQLLKATRVSTIKQQEKDNEIARVPQEIQCAYQMG
jgi:hypothetical protein